jgi:hypothetical protein
MIIWTGSRRRAALLSTAEAPHPVSAGRVNWRNVRSTLALCLLIGLCASGNAAARGHRAISRHILVRPTHSVNPSYVTPYGMRIYRDDSVPGGLRTEHDDPPAYDDPSKFSGG